MSNLTKLWSDRFADYSYNNYTFGVASLHLLIGQLLKYQKITKKGQIIDLRCNLYAMMDTGSGKSVALDIVDNYASGLGLNVMSIDDMTDAALLGTIEQEVEYNEYNDKIVNYNIVSGIMAEADIIHFDEAEVLLNPSKNSQNAKLYFQKGMNPIGTPSNIIKKKLAHGDPIRIPVEASFYFTSYVPEKFESLIVHTGLLPRMLMVPKELTYADRQENSFTDIDNLGSTDDSSGNDKEIMSVLKQIKSAGQQRLDFNFENTKPLLRNKVTAMYDISTQSSYTTQKLINGFVPRYQNLLYVLSAHRAVMDDRMNIKAEDINSVFKSLIYPAITGVLTLLEIATTQNQTGIAKENMLRGVIMQEYAKLTNKNGWVGLKQLSLNVGMATHTSDGTARKHINTLTTKGYFAQSREGNVVLIRPVEIK